MSDSKSKHSSNHLTEASFELESSFKIFQDINQKGHFIALSAAIEGARMKGKLNTFSIVANQIGNQASKNGELSEKLENLISKIKSKSQDAIAIRNLELATDLIDKLDRNLFGLHPFSWRDFPVVA